MQLDSKELSKIKETINILSKLKDDDTYGEAVCIAIPLLEKNIPQKPIGKWDCGAHVVYCPNCKNKVYDPDWFRSTKERYHTTRCLYCNQKFTQTGNYLGEWKD